MRLILTLAMLLGFAISAQAQISVLDIQNSSNYERNFDGTIAKIYGGIAGTCVAPTANSTCDSCHTADTACNRVRIHENLDLRFSIQVEADVTGTLVVGTNTGTYTPMTLAESNCRVLSQGDRCSFSINWGSLCNNATGGAAPTCAALGGSLTLIVGLARNAASEPSSESRILIPIDVTIPNADFASRNGFNEVECGSASPSTGICTMLVYPGDGKVFIDELEAVGSWPLSNSVALKYLRVYYSTVSFADAGYVNTPTNAYASFELDNNGVPTHDEIVGLENNKQYFFRPGVVDRAYNEAFLSNDDEIVGGAMVAGTGCAAYADLNCDLIAVPTSTIDRALGYLGL